MPNYAQITLIGHLGRDAETKFSQGGTAITSFSLAVSETRKNKSGEKIKETSWFNCVLFSEKLTQYLTKGKPIMVVGTPKMESWEKDGVKHAALKVIADKITFLGDGQRQESRQEPAAEASDGCSDVPF